MSSIRNTRTSRRIRLYTSTTFKRMLTSYSQRVLVDVALVVTDVAVAVNVVLLMNIPFSTSLKPVIKIRTNYLNAVLKRAKMHKLPMTRFVHSKCLHKRLRA
jgi:hypothetical protein